MKKLFSKFLNDFDLLDFPRFYDVRVKKLEPNNDALSGGAHCKLMGDGFFDTLSKRIMFKSKYGERLIDINWDKKERSFTFIAPPLNWYDKPII